MTTPNLSESLDQLAGAVPADPDDHGPIAVPSDAVRAVVGDLTDGGGGIREHAPTEVRIVHAFDGDVRRLLHALAKGRLESWVNTPRATQPETT